MREAQHYCWDGRTMANQPHAFKNRDITRCLKAASAAGVSHPTVEVHLLPGGATKYVVGGEVLPQPRKSAERRADKTENAAPGAKRVSGGRPPRVAGGLAMPALPGSTGTDIARRKGRTP